MTTILLTLTCGAFLLLAITLQKTYTHTPLRELKRRARKGDELAKALHRAATFGVSLEVLLWLWVGVSAAVFTYVLVQRMPTFLALFGLASVTWFGFAWLPKSRVSAASIRIAALFAPILSWILNYAHPFLEKIGLVVSRRLPKQHQTKIYEKEDLISLLNQQMEQADNRVAKEELDIARHALQFGDKLVRDVFVPRRMVREVSLEEKIGPILMEELHKSGHSRFPVYDGKKDNIVGTLMLRDLLGVRTGGVVKDVVHQTVLYLHESQNLYQALHAMLKTRHHMFIVVNDFEEIVGIITLEDVIETIIGKPIVDEFDNYDDLRAVAASQAKQIHEEQAHEKLPDSDQR
jgi:CBS domain containing-hemolysin-like protein